jgi:hypothetical protein
MKYTKFLNSYTTSGNDVTWIFTKDKFKESIIKMTRAEFALWLDKPLIIAYELDRLTSIWYGLYLRKKGR